MLDGLSDLEVVVMSAQINTLLETLLSPGEWFQIPYCVLKTCTPQEAVLFMYLVSKSRQFRASEKDGWFYCTVKGAELEIGMTEDVQRRAVVKLKKRGWLESRQQGLPAKRHFSIDFAKAVLDCTGVEIESPELGSAKTPELGSAKTPDLSLYKGELKKKTAVQENGGGPSKNIPDPKKPSDGKEWWRFHKDKWSRTDRELAKLLRTVMKDRTTDLFYNKRMTRDVYIENIWRVRSKRKVGREEIEEVLWWYQDNYGKPYVPELKQLYDFEKKFNSLQMAMGRTEQDEKKPSSRDEFFNKQREQDKRDELNMEFEHLYFTRWPEHAEPLPAQSNEICKQMGILPRFRYEGESEDGYSIWSRID